MAASLLIPRKPRNTRALRRFAGLTLALWALLAVAPAAVAAPVQVWAGQHSGVKAFAVAVVRDEDDWQALWSGLRRGAPPPLRAGQHIGIAIYLGLRNTGGFGVEMAGVRREGALSVVSFRTIAPAADSFVTQVLTTPYLLARIADDGAPVAFRRLADDGDRRLILPQSEVDVLNALVDGLRALPRRGASPED